MGSEDKYSNSTVPADDNLYTSVEVQQDSINDPKNQIGAQYDSSLNMITIKYMIGNDKFNEWADSDGSVVHENKHKTNAQQGIHAYAVSPEQAYKLQMHDEISANIADLISRRHEYLQTGDLSVFDDPDGKFDFYKAAIKIGYINPKSEYQEDFDEEMYLIANGTRDKWMELYGSADENYQIAGIQHGIFSSDFLGEYNPSCYDANYQKCKDIAYGNIGGVDFGKYMDKDVEIPKTTQEMWSDAKKAFSQWDETRFLEKRQEMNRVYTRGNEDTENTVPQRRVAAVARKGNEVHKSETEEKGWFDNIKDAAKSAYHKAQNAWNSATDTVSGWFGKKKSGDEKMFDTPNPDVVVPQKWMDKDGQRFSEVQKRYILDMSKDVIKKPTKTREDDAKKKDNTKKTAKRDADNAKKYSDKKVEQTKKQTHAKSQSKSSQTQAKSDLKQSLKADSDNKNKMIQIIDNMNKTNGSNVSIPSVEYTEALIAKYGNNAYDLLLEAVTKPTEYAQITGNKEIRNSRAAVEDLISRDNSQQNQQIMNRLLQNRGR